MTKKKRKLRIGDLVYYDCEGCKGKGLVTFPSMFKNSCVEIIEKGQDLKFVLGREDVIKIIPREEIKAYWRYL